MTTATATGPAKHRAQAPARTNPRAAAAARRWPPSGCTSAWSSPP
ncbi:hypothetical protein RGF97_24840 [Streptomyces roseicoloratus]|uniref:Uncharacterized protein n=1 Tax=Streptomyces roseicoloratus TaxID=2508722 RepID=A0ABY9RZ07_9ACTN|nr:hypothetical protein [Streptomyces roseicoloratus]WMX47407.1 hypothetical protein RGF97_24840 [Streptomyces roseicoloratus]